MKKEVFFEILGGLDPALVKAAKTPVKQEIPRQLWVVMAGSLCLIAAATVLIPVYQHIDAGSAPDGDSFGYEQSAELAPMVCVNRTLYQIMGAQPDITGQEAEFVYLGEITDAVSSSQKPTEDFQANDDITGARLYLYDGELLAVEINGQYWLYEPLYEYQN